jgi:hypothetical protein
MKKILLLLTILTFAINVNAQNSETDGAKSATLFGKMINAISNREIASSPNYEKIQASISATGKLKELTDLRSVMATCLSLLPYEIFADRGKEMVKLINDEDFKMESKKSYTAFMIELESTIAKEIFSDAWNKTERAAWLKEIAINK